MANNFCTSDGAAFSSRSNEWATPRRLFDMLDAEFHFTLDAAATKENALCDMYYTQRDNGLLLPWQDTTWCNPPYGREIGLWVAKAQSESDNARSVMLIPARTDTTYWHDYIFPRASEIRFIRGRLHFNESKAGAPFPSAVIVFSNTWRRQVITTMSFGQ